MRTYVLLPVLACLVLALALPASAGENPTAWVIDGKAYISPPGQVFMIDRHAPNGSGIRCTFNPKHPDPDLRGVLCSPRQGQLYQGNRLSPSLWVSITSKRIVVMEYRADALLHVLQRFNRR
jgi:hypothetical protein